MKHYFKIKVSDMQILQAELTRLETKQRNKKLNGMPISRFLLVNSIMDDNDDAVEKRVKRIVLYTAGDFHTDPDDLDPGTVLTVHLLYSEDKFVILAIKLNALVKEFGPDKGISQDEVDKCKTVQDCIKLVQSK